MKESLTDRAFEILDSLTLEQIEELEKKIVPQASASFMD